MRKLRVLIVDDEPIARQHLLVYLEREADLEILGECNGGLPAVDAIRAQAPDLVFLDVQMPDLDGFGVLDRLLPAPLPAIIFVTAYDEYAVRAFRVQALDYLLKPFDGERFRETLERARQRLQQTRAEDLDQRLRDLARHTAGRQPPLERLAVKVGEASIVLQAQEIDWIESEANYVRIHTCGSSHLVRRTLRSLEEALDPFRFVRIHRRVIVNADRIRRLAPWSHGDMRITLVDGTELNLSRRYRDRLERLVAGIGPGT